MPHLAENPMKIGWLVPEIQAVEDCSKQQKAKEIFLLNWLHFKINSDEFRLANSGINHSSMGNICVQDFGYLTSMWENST